MSVRNSIMTYRPFREFAVQAFRERPWLGKHNVGTPERIASIVTGLVIAGTGRRAKGPVKMLANAAALALLQRGVMGVCPMYKCLGLNTAKQPALDREGSVKVEQSIVVHRPVEVLY